MTGEETRSGPIICFATQGHRHIEGERIRVLLGRLDAEEFEFDRARKLRSAPAWCASS